VEGVSDGKANAKHVVRVELDVVLDMVVVNLGTDKDVVPDRIADAGADVLHEVIAVGVVDAAGDVTRGRKIEPGGSDANPAQEFEANFLAKAGLEERVDVGEGGAVFLETVVVSLPYSKGSFEIKAEAPVLEADKVSADVEVGATFFRRRLEVYRLAGGRRGHEGAAADGDINLLSVSKSG